MFLSMNHYARMYSCYSFIGIFLFQFWMKKRMWIERVKIYYAFLSIYPFWFMLSRLNIYARINGYSLTSICMISFLDEDENVDRTSTNL